MRLIACSLMLAGLALMIFVSNNYLYLMYISITDMVIPASNCKSIQDLDSKIRPRVSMQHDAGVTFN